MKRMLLLLLCAVILAALCACGPEPTSAPAGVAQETYALGESVLGIAQQYLAGKCTAREAAEQIAPLCRSFDAVNPADPSEQLYNVLIHLAAESLLYNLNAIADGAYVGDDQVERDCAVLSDYLAGIRG